MDKSKDDDAYPNDVPLELEASQSDMDNQSRTLSELQNRLLRQLHQARESRRSRAEDLEHEAEPQDIPLQSPDDITNEEQMRIDDENDERFSCQLKKAKEESTRLQAESPRHEPHQDTDPQSPAEVTYDWGEISIDDEKEARLLERLKKNQEERRRLWARNPEHQPGQLDVTPDAPQSPEEVTSTIDGDAAWDKSISTNTTDLPVVPGPKLAPFRPLADPLDIKFEEPLHEGRFSHIWKVSCRGYVYALKIFKPGKASVLLEKWNDDDCPLPWGMKRRSFESLNHYTDPFLNECRVYGRLKQANKENLAIDCYGYVLFSSAYLEGKGIDLGTASTSDPSSVRGSKPGIIHEGLPEEPVGHGSELIYALLKDLPPSDANTQRPTAIEVRHMAKDLLLLHKLGIFHASISHSSYVAGKLVDFGTAQTAPSPWLDGVYEGMNPARIGKDPSFSDQKDFDEKVVDYWNAHAEIPTPDLQEKTQDKKGRPKQIKAKREFLANMRIGDGWFNPINSTWRHPRPDVYPPKNSHAGKRKWSNDGAESIERQTDPGSGVQSSAKKQKHGEGGAT